MQAIIPRVPVVYRIADLSGDVIEGTFYETELQKIEKDLNTATWLIERVIRRRRNRETGEREAFVKWRGWGDRWNSWIPEEAIEQHGAPN